MLGFARNIVFLGKRSFRCGEKLARLRDGCGRRRFSGSSLMLLCSCVLHALRHFVHWNCCIEELCSLLELLEFE